MKAALAALFIIGIAAMIFPASALDGSGSTSILGFEKPPTGASNIDTRSIETKMAESLRGLGQKVPGATDDEGGMIINTGNTKARLPGSNLDNSIQDGTRFSNPSSNNSSASNSSMLNSSALNSTALNSTALNSTALNTSDVNSVDGAGLGSTGASASGAGSLSGSTEAGSEGVSTSSSASVKGFYGVTASRHEMGKSDIKSKMFLSGDFDVEKTVQFQDQGF